MLTSSQRNFSIRFAFSPLFPALKDRDPKPTRRKTMKNLKRLVWAIAALTAFLMPPNAALAVFKGSVRGDLPLTFEVQPAPSNTDSTAVTITFIDSKGRPDVEALTFEVGAGQGNTHSV